MRKSIKPSINMVYYMQCLCEVNGLLFLQSLLNITGQIYDQTPGPLPGIYDNWVKIYPI